MLQALWPKISNQKAEAEAKSGTLDGELIFLKYGLVCFYKTFWRSMGLCMRKMGSDRIQKRDYTSAEKTKHV